MLTVGLLVVSAAACSSESESVSLEGTPVVDDGGQTYMGAAGSAPSSAGQGGTGGAMVTPSVADAGGTSGDTSIMARAVAGASGGAAGMSSAGTGHSGGVGGVAGASVAGQGAGGVAGNVEAGTGGVGGDTAAAGQGGSDVGSAGQGGDTAIGGNGGAGGQSGAAGSGSMCVPKTCAEQHFNCNWGDNTDGCGHPLDCGSCSQGGVCGGDGYSRCGNRLNTFVKDGTNGWSCKTTQANAGPGLDFNQLVRVPFGVPFPTYITNSFHYEDRCIMYMQLSNNDVLYCCMGSPFGDLF